jgi:hypothetical protein
MSEGKEPGALSVIVDGVPLAADDARALWQRFSEWMEEHKGDLAGFAAREGFASIHPAVEGGRPILRASHTEAQRPYAPVAHARKGEGGSGGRHGRKRRHRAASPKTRK